jgi:uncharacterized phage protein gp47/JayE
VSASSVPFPTYGANGLVLPNEQDVFVGVLADMVAAFGGNLNTSPATPQGQMATTAAAALMGCFELMAAIVNGVDPAYASGRMQDAIARIYFLYRQGATPTQVVCACGGAAGVNIPAGALAQDVGGNLYACVTGGVIPSGGSINLTFAALIPGPTPCPAGSLTIIYQAISGWDTITNAANGTLGQDQEGRAAFEQRRQAAVQQNSFGAAGAVMGALLGNNVDGSPRVPGVTDAYVVDNPTSAPATIGGVSVAANSLYAVVVGGSDAAVAQAIFSKKSPGAPYQGATSVTVTDTNPLYQTPPTYTVKFDRQTDVPIFFAVNIATGPNVPSNAAQLVQNAIVNAWNGADGGPSARLGSLLLALRYVNPIAALGSWAQVRSIAVGLTASGPAPALASLQMNINQRPTITAANIAVTVS